MTVRVSPRGIDRKSTQRISDGFCLRWLRWLLLLSALLPAAMRGEEPSLWRAEEICRNRGVAEERLASLPLRALEGIWEFPADEVALVVLRIPEQKGRYGVYLLESVDCRLWPGMQLGWLEESADPKKFRISLSSRINKGLPVGNMQGMATLGKDADILTIEMPKVKLSFTPSVLLPSLWNMLKLSTRLSTRNPLERLPEGWVKTFPSYDGSGSSRRYIRYL